MNSVIFPQQAPTFMDSRILSFCHFHEHLPSRWCFHAKLAPENVWLLFGTKLGLLHQGGWSPQYVERQTGGSEYELLKTFKGEQCAFNEETSQELRMLSSVTLDCQETKIVMNSGSQLSEI